MRVLHASMLGLLLVAACVSTPKNPFDNDAAPGSDGGVETVRCDPDPCTFPPSDDFSDIVLLPGISAKVDNNDFQDLVVGNAPTASAQWGFFFIPDVGEQPGALQAIPFRVTARRPEAIHVEEGAEEGDPARVFVFGSDSQQQAGVEIYRWTIAAGFVLESEIDGITPSNLWSSHLPAAAIGVGQFDGDGSAEAPDIVVARGSKIYASFCNEGVMSADCGSFEEVAIADDGVSASGPAFPDAKSVRGLWIRPTQFIGAPFASVGTSDVLIAGDANLRMLSFGKAIGDSSDRWRSLANLAEFSDDAIGADREGVMGEMSSSFLAPLIPNQSNPLDLAMIGPGTGGFSKGNIDITSFGSYEGVIQPTERYRWDGPPAGEDGLLNDPHALHVAELNGTSEPEILFANTTTEGETEIWVLAEVGDPGDPEPSTGTPQPIFGNTDSFRTSREGVVSITTDSDNRILVLFRDGQCLDLSLDTGDLLIEAAAATTRCP